MCETTKTERVREFCAMARLSAPNTDASLAAQRFFKHHLMQVQDANTLRPFPAIPAAQRAQLQMSFVTAVQNVSRVLTGTEHQTDVSVTRLIAEIPLLETGIRHTIHKVGLEMGMTAAR